jgi:hypothetical protein
VATVAEATAAAGQKMPSYGDYYEFSKLSAADVHFVAVFKGFVGNRKVGEFLLVAQW